MTQAKNIAASVRQRLLNHSKEVNKPFSEILQYFVTERFLYRLSCSNFADTFILKGAMLLRFITKAVSRPTLDIDMLGYTRNEQDNIEAIINKILTIECDDGIEFKLNSIETEIIKEDADYEGVRVKFTAVLDKAKIYMQIDVGFGDVVYPSPCRNTFKPILDFPAPELHCYTPESVIAEKFEAMITLDMLNSRVKDFFDIWLLSRQFEFDNAILSEAIRKTLEARKTKLPSQVTAFSNEFSTQRQAQWLAFLSRSRITYAPLDFSRVVGDIEHFLQPALDLI